MELENSFVVPAPPETVWSALLDVESVAPCMPGAEITEAVDERTWKGKVTVKLGPVSLAFAGTIEQQQVDEEARRVVLKGQGTETRGKGTASATVTSRLESAEDGTRVVVVTDLQITGAVAQYGRGMIADVSKRFTDEFAECLADTLGGVGAEGPAAARDARAAEAGPTVPEPRDRGHGERRRAKPVSGLRIGLWALGRAIKRTVRRIVPFGSGEGSE